jgi:hypothetical protein
VTNKSKPGNCDCGASVSYYGIGRRGWDCGRRERFIEGTSSPSVSPATGSWVVTDACPIPKLVNDTKAENIQLRNTISQLTEQIAELEAHITACQANEKLRKETATSA